MKKLFLLSAFLLAVFTSCANRELRKELRTLDKVIDNREVYLNRFYSKVAATRDSLTISSSDSISWIYSYRLFNDFVRFSTDSALVYLGKMERYATACSSLEKARVFDPFGHAGLTPLGEIRLTLAGEIKMTPVEASAGEFFL